MTFRKILCSICIFSLAAPLQADDLSYTIKGQASESPQLETLSPSPDIPDVNAILFSLDGGTSAREKEVIPLKEFEAALLTDPSQTPYPVLPLIPSQPFITQRLPIGDKRDLKRNRIFDETRETSQMDYEWTFQIYDDENKEVASLNGMGRPPNPLMWDGTDGEKFVLDPNRTYSSVLVVKAADRVLGTWPGEGVRFLCLTYKEGDDLIIEFSRRVYNEFEATFSGPGQIFLSDFGRRLYYHLRGSYLDPEGKADWHMTLFNPPSLNENGISEARKQTWLAYVEETLGEAVSEDHVSLKTSNPGDSRVRVVLKNYASPEEPNMRGFPSLTRPHFEKKKKWVKIRERKDNMVVELRHDRLFLPGSAYLRDEALEDLSMALAKVHAKSQEKQTAIEPEKKKEKKNKKKGNIILRSYSEKVRDRKRNKVESDPKLAALRTKVLFMLFSKERYLKK